MSAHVNPLQALLRVWNLWTSLTSWQHLFRCISFNTWSLPGVVSINGRLKWRCRRGRQTLEQQASWTRDEQQTSSIRGHIGDPQCSECTWRELFIDWCIFDCFANLFSSYFAFSISLWHVCMGVCSCVLLWGHPRVYVFPLSHFSPHHHHYNHHHVVCYCS